MYARYYSPQSNSRVERLHRTLHNVLAKKLTHGQHTWDLHLNQVLAAIRFNVSEATDYSPYCLLYNRHVLLPIDNLLKPRLKYQGEDLHQISLQEQHKAFMLVHSRFKKQKCWQAKYANKNCTDIQFKVGDLVFYRKHARTGKQDIKWETFYRVTECKSPVTYVIRNQLEGKTVKVHARHLKLAKVDNWEIPKTSEGRPICKAVYVLPPPDIDKNSSDFSASESVNPQRKLAAKYCREREDSDDEEDIPLMELAKHMKARECREAEEKTPMSSESNLPSDTSDNRIYGYNRL